MSSGSDVVCDSLRTRPVSDQKNGLGLAGLVLCCETRSCYARRHNDLKGQQLFKYNL